MFFASIYLYLLICTRLAICTDCQVCTLIFKMNVNSALCFDMAFVHALSHTHTHILMYVIFFVCFKCIDVPIPHALKVFDVVNFPARRTALSHHSVNGHPVHQHACQVFTRLPTLFAWKSLKITIVLFCFWSLQCLDFVAPIRQRTPWYCDMHI